MITDGLVFSRQIQSAAIHCLLSELGVSGSYWEFDLGKCPKELQKTMQSTSEMLSKTLGNRQKFETALETYFFSSKHRKI